MMRADLEAARNLWLAEDASLRRGVESDFCSRRDPDADLRFHVHSNYQGERAYALMKSPRLANGPPQRLSAARWIS